MGYVNLYQSIIGSSNGSAELPVGTIIIKSDQIVPTGYLECNGQAINRAVYSNLFNSIGEIYGIGDGLNTFNIPDYRGYFLRGYDNGSGIDPDSSSRIDSGNGTIGDNIGTKQLDNFKSHSHPIRSTHTVGTLTSTEYRINTADAYPSTTQTIQSSGGNETRPKNINVMYCIKH